VVIIGTGVIFPLFMMDFKNFNYKKHSVSFTSFDKNFYILTIGVTVYFMAFSFNNNFINIKIAESGLSQLSAGTMWAAGVFLEIIIMFFSGKFLYKINSIIWMQLAIFTGFFRWLLIGLYSDKIILYFASSLHGISFGLFHLAMMQYIKESISKERRLKAQGIYAASAYGLGSIAGSFFSGVVYDLLGVNATFLTASVISLISMIIIAKSCNYNIKFINSRV
jgi:MFS family permease